MLTVAEVLRTAELLAGIPTVVAGSAGLNNPVRWVHVSELPGIAPQLKGGELLLTTGIALSDDPGMLLKYVASLSKAKVAGLVLELGERFTRPPAELIAAGDRYAFPIAILSQKVRFVAVTEAVHALIIDSQLDELRLSESIHETFASLALEGASPGEIVRRASAMTGRPILFEDIGHHVVAFEPGDTLPDQLIDDWGSRSQLLAESSGSGSADGWLTSAVRARGEAWGTLVMSTGEGSPLPIWRVVLKQASVALAFNRLVERDQQSLERQSHRSFLADILSGAQTSRHLEARAKALGVQLNGRSLFGCVVRRRHSASEDALAGAGLDRNLADRVAFAAREARVHALSGLLAPTLVGAIISAPNEKEGRAVVERLARALHRLLDDENQGGQLIVAVGATVSEVRDLRGSLSEALQVADVIDEATPKKDLYELPDIRIRGLLHMLRGDKRVQDFFEREIGPLMRHDHRHGTRLLNALDAYLRLGRNKSAAARELRLSRPAFYARIQKAQQILGADLDAPESAVSLHVALLGLQQSRPSLLEAQGGRH